MKQILSLLRALLLVAMLAAPFGAVAQQKQLGPLPAISAPSVTNPVANVPASLTSLGSFTSGCIGAGYYRSFTAFAALAGAATLTVQRYIDAPTSPGVGGCTVLAGAPVPPTPLPLTSGGGCPGSTSCGTVGSNDGMSFGALTITITDASTSTNGITAIQLMQGAE